MLNSLSQTVDKSEKINYIPECVGTFESKSTVSASIPPYIQLKKVEKKFIKIDLKI